MKQFAAFLLAISILSACDKPQGESVTINNSQVFPISDAPVQLKPQDLPDGIDKSKSLSWKYPKGGDIPFQKIDTDQDGQWDFALSMANLLPGENKLTISSGLDGPDIPPPTKTDVYFARKTSENTYDRIEQANRVAGSETKVTIAHFQFEGPGWENDQIAFRNYFDDRNGIDIFGKTVNGMILSQVGTGANYHEIQPWGMDILKVGTSLGAGGIALWYQD
ncbi:MAG: DUF4861 family protein, partial [Bacteroidota bacterium]